MNLQMTDFSFTMVKEILEAFTNLGNAVAWPGVVAIVAIRYRSELRSILNRLEKAKLGEAEFLLSKEQTEKTLAKTSEQAINLISKSIESQIRSSEFDMNQEKDRLVAVHTGDIDGDGKDELVVSNIEGSHSVCIKVFKPIINLIEDKGLETSFKLIGEIYPANFLEDVQDVDSDKYAEIIVNEDERESSEPHAAGKRERVTYKWIEGQLLEISREKLPLLNTQGEMNQFAELEYENIDKKMNEIWQKIVSDLEEKVELKKFMETAQEAWLKFRELQAQAISKVYEGGSIQPLVYYNCMINITNQRIRELEKIANTKDGILD